MLYFSKYRRSLDAGQNRTFHKTREQMVAGNNLPLSKTLFLMGW